ncbi:MAG: Cas9 inhibitor AcrIIA9 family protein [Hungatella sp.]
MFDKFGEFDSFEELNRAAEGLYNEGDFANLYELAAENGIDRECTKLYCEGEIPVLSDAAAAAMGKVDIELEEAREAYGETAECVAEYIKSLCDRREFAELVRKKKKRFIKCLDHMYREAEKVRKGNCACIPPSAGYKMIREYYTGG